MYGAQSNRPSYGESLGVSSEPREPGARRKKFAGYLKAANELRQTYFSADPNSHASHAPEDGPGAFPDAAVARSGNEELILFPSYARRHVQRQSDRRATPRYDLTEEEYWRQEWNKHEDSNAIVNAEVRGWLYTPHRGPNTRKQRLLIGLARQLSGLPAPAAGNIDPSNRVTSRSSSPERSNQQEEDLIAFEAENIVRQGQREERYADRGVFSESPGQYVETGNPTQSKDRQKSKATTASYPGDDPPQIDVPLRKRDSWAQPSKMTAAELAVANQHLLNRLKPFMSNPMANTAISAFFYSDQDSRQQTVYTDAAGHFHFRAALDFVPTHVRVLAAERLSITEEVHVTSPRGVSIISDIDDTIKHSAISAGPREIFRNAFIRELSDLTIEGVREWYTTMHDMGVRLHYVSNSPWQMYPVLTSYFKLANLPKGSFHLKQYSGMLQGIFEPVAERKKASLDKILRDFPDRKFILIGDSGEADLEVYTETALDYPGRIIGIFIRDVTTTVKSGYFDSNVTPPGGNSRHHTRHASGDSLIMAKRLSRPDDIRNDDADFRAAVAASLQDMEDEARRARRFMNPDALTIERLDGPAPDIGQPRLPPRRNTKLPIESPAEEDLIDFTEAPPTRPWLKPPERDLPTGSRNLDGTLTSKKPSPSPPPPPKPAGLRNPPPNPLSQSQPDGKPVPPRPRKPSSAVKPLTSIVSPSPSLQTPSSGVAVNPSPLSQVTRQASTAKQPPPLPARRTYKEFAKEKIGSYWQSDVPIGQSRPRTAGSRNNSQPSSPLARPMSTAKSFEDLNLPDSASQGTRPPLPARRNVSAYSTASRKPKRLSRTWEDDSNASSPGDGLSRKEIMWHERWARAKDILERRGVTLRTWRTGVDVADICVRLVEMELRDIEKDKKMGKA